MPDQNPSTRNNSIYKLRETYFYVIPQYFLIIYLLATGPLITDNYAFIFLEIIGFWFLLWVMWTNYFTKFDLSFKPRSNARLIPKGPYKFIRHPFSSALLLISLILILNYITLARLVAWVAFIVIIFLRVRYEEKIFTSYFNDYKLYKQRTYNLFPFIY